MKKILFIPACIILLFHLSGKVAGQISFSDSLKSVLSNTSDSSKVRIYNELSEYYLDSALYLSLEYAEKGLLLSKDQKWLWGEAYSENLMGIAYYYLSDYSQSLTYFRSSLKKRNLIGNNEEIAASYNNIAMVYTEYENYDLAIECINNSMEINQEEGLVIDVADNLHNLATIYWEKKDYQSAIKYTTESLAIYKQLEIEHGIADIYNNLGNLYKETGKLDEAMDNLKIALEVYKNENNLKGVATTKLNLAELLFFLNKFNEGYVYLKDALPIAKSLQSKDLLLEIHEYLAKYFKQKKNYKEALRHQKIYNSYKDSIYTQLQGDIILEEQVELSAENQLQEIQKLKKDHELQDVEIQKQKSIGIFLIILMGVSFSTILLFNVILKLRDKTTNLLKEKNVQLYYSNKELEKSKFELSKLNQEKDKFFSIIAHDLISPFASFISLSEILHNNTDSLDEKDIKKYSGWIFTSAKNIFNLVDNLLQWSRSQSGKLNYSPRHLILSNVIEETISIVKPSATDKNIRILSPILKNQKVHTDSDILSTILRNLLSNAIKFTDQNGSITISANDNGKMIEVSVTDSGIGIKPEDLGKLFQLDKNFTTKGTSGEEGNGLGLILCKEFIQALGGTIHVKSELNYGSTFMFTIPKIPIEVESRNG